MTAPGTPGGVDAAVVVLTGDERRALHEAVCPSHRDTVPGVYVCGPCESVGDAAVGRIVAARVAQARREVAEEIAAAIERRLITSPVCRRDHNCRVRAAARIARAAADPQGPS